MAVHCEPEDFEDCYKSYENTALVYISVFQYLIICMVFSISKPFRQPLYTNLYFTISLIILMVFSGYMVMSNESWMLWLFDIEDNVSLEFRLTIMIAIVINSIVSYLFERFAIWYVSQWWKNRKDAIKMKNLEKEIEEEKEKQ